MRHKIRRIHFVGIGGAGMSGLAEALLQMGYEVSGSDAADGAALARLAAAGARVFVGHSAAHADGADCVVYSSAVPANNPERAAALARKTPVVPRAQMLGELMRFKRGIAVAGTHGKTTIASMTAAVLLAANESPTCVIGGRVRALRGGALLGDGDYVVVEADESDASFLHLHPELAVVANIDNDHLEAFDDDEATLAAAFEGFLKNLPFYGAAILCADNPAALALRQKMSALRCVTYGFAANADVRAVNARYDENGASFDLLAAGAKTPTQTRAWGRHNAQNALAAAAVGVELGLPLPAIARGLKNFEGVGRRLESYGELQLGGKRVLLVDDYAHHPTEIAASLAALRAAYPRRRLLLAFQPHRHSRTTRLLAELAQSLGAADELALAAVYAAGEPPPKEPAEQKLLAATPAATKHYCPDWRDLPRLLATRAQDGDLLVTMGAGSICALPDLLVKAAAQKGGQQSGQKGARHA